MLLLPSKKAKMQKLNLEKYLLENNMETFLPPLNYFKISCIMILLHEPVD